MIDLAGPSAKRFGLITLDELNRQATLLDRMENKYVVRSESAREIVERLKDDFNLLRIGDKVVFTYETIYFDSDNLVAYRAHAQGRRKRFKIRSRHYVDSGLYYFEVKLKGVRDRTIKERIRHDGREHGQMSDGIRAFVRDCFREVYGEDFRHEIGPTLKMQCKRITLVGKGSPERVTMDFDLEFFRADGSAVPVPEGSVVVEVKSERGLGVADRVIRRLGVRETSYSKYFIGLKAARPELKGNPTSQSFLRLSPSVAPVAGGALCEED